MTPTYDAIVIGAGVVGCSIAHALARRGHRVCVLERGGSVACGSTSSSSAVVRYNFSTWVGVATAWESRHAWEKWADHLEAQPDADLARLVKTGGLTLDSPNQDRQRVLALFDRVGVPYEVWDAERIRERLPLVDPGRHHPPKPIDDDAFWAEPDGELSGYWTPDAGFVNDPQLAARNLLDAAVAHGAEICLRSEVTAVRQGPRTRGVTVNGDTDLDAPIVVNAAGPHSGAINRLALGENDDFAVKTRPLRQEVHEVPAPAAYSNGVPGALIADVDLGTYFRGTPSGGLLVGGTEPACDPLQWLDAPDDAEPRVTSAVYDAQVLRAARRLPSLQVPPRPRGVVGVYDVSDDWIPVYDRTALDGFYVAIGTSGNQFKNAPVVGDFLAEIIEACEDGRDHDTRPVQFTLPRTGHVVDLSHYSRRRPITAGSSFSVMG